ncbi:MAG: SIS domain-containing protein, partial [Steroidobacteraceae bacterium]
MGAEKADSPTARSEALLHSALEEHLNAFRHLPTLSSVIQQAAGLVAASLANGHKLMLCGNGGSAADSQHIAAEMTGRFLKDRRPL